MTFDLAQHLLAMFWWGFFCLVFGAVVLALVIFAPAPLAIWLQFHVPWLYGIFHNSVVCPNGYVCSPVR